MRSWPLPRMLGSVAVAAAGCNLLIVVPEPAETAAEDGGGAAEASASVVDSGSPVPSDAGKDGTSRDSATDSESADEEAASAAPVIVLAGPRAEPLALALDPDRDSLYWTETAGGVYRVSKDGGKITVLKDPDDGGSAGAIVAAGTNVYWADRAHGNIAYASVTDGGKVGVFAKSPGGAPLALATDGTNLYWSDGASNRIYRAPTAGLNAGDVETFVSPSDAAVPDPTARNVHAMTATPHWLVWAEADSPFVPYGYVYVLSLDTPEAGPNDLTGLIEANTDVLWISTDGSNVFWTDMSSTSANVITEPYIHGANENFFETDERCPGPVVVNATGNDVFWLNWGAWPGGGPDAGGALRHAHQGPPGAWTQPGTTLAPAESPMAIALDANAVYWINGGAAGSIVKFLLASVP